MNDGTLTYENWILKVKPWLHSLKEKLDANELARELYNGFYIWDSKFIQNPQLMFIGINPGDGNPNNNRSIRTEPEEQFAYIEFMDGENDSYTLARETVEALEMAGFSESDIRKLFNEDAVKTNFQYVITKGEGEIKQCFNALEGYSYKQYNHESYDLTLELIQIVNPRIIICEGKSVFDEVESYFDHLEFVTMGQCHYVILPNNQVVIGYNRRRSNIADKSCLAEIFKKFIRVN
jgi:hypothetical protein